jgi:hypothetical protein
MGLPDELQDGGVLPERALNELRTVRIDCKTGAWTQRGAYFPFRLKPTLEALLVARG